MSTAAAYSSLPEVTAYPNSMKFMHWAMAGGIGGCVVTVQVGNPTRTPTCVTRDHNVLCKEQLFSPNAYLVGNPFASVLRPTNTWVAHNSAVGLHMMGATDIATA
eukprot:6236968-Pyramimonas_sp.AAC.2